MRTEYFTTFLKYVITILIFYQSESVRINFIKEIFLKIDLILNVFDRFLNNSTAIRMLRKIDYFSSEDIKEFFLLFLWTFFKNLLKDIVPKTIFHKWFMFFKNEWENELFRVLFTCFKYVLYCSGSILVSGPFGDLRKVTKKFLLRSKSCVIIVIGDVDHLVAHVILILKWKSGLLGRGYFLIELTGGENKS